MWEAVEREYDIYDLAYLDRINELINKLGEKGIYTLVDAHQDVFSRHYCGEGMPAFYATGKDVEHECEGWLLPFILKTKGICKSIKDYNFRKDAQGFPLIEDCNAHFFARYYGTPEAMSAFD